MVVTRFPLQTRPVDRFHEFRENKVQNKNSREPQIWLGAAGSSPSSSAVGIRNGDIPQLVLQRQ
jgi:hypothetical protein